MSLRGFLASLFAPAGAVQIDFYTDDLSDPTSTVFGGVIPEAGDSLCLRGVAYTVIARAWVIEAAMGTDRMLAAVYLRPVTVSPRGQK